MSLRLPKALAEDAQLVEGTTVELRVEGGSLVVALARKRYRLADLLAETETEAAACQGETDWDAPRGKEIW